MTDAPERIWVDFSDVLYGFEDASPRVILDIKGCADKAVEKVCGYTNYIRKDLAAPERELASELAGTLWQWLELAERTMEDHALRLDANRAADFCQGIRETKTVLAKLDKGE